MVLKKQEIYGRGAWTWNPRPWALVAPYPRLRGPWSWIRGRGAYRLAKTLRRACPSRPPERARPADAARRARRRAIWFVCCMTAMVRVASRAGGAVAPVNLTWLWPFAVSLPCVRAIPKLRARWMMPWGGWGRRAPNVARRASSNLARAAYSVMWCGAPQTFLRMCNMNIGLTPLLFKRLLCSRAAYLQIERRVLHGICFTLPA